MSSFSNGKKVDYFLVTAEASCDNQTHIMRGGGPALGLPDAGHATLSRVETIMTVAGKCVVIMCAAVLSSILISVQVHAQADDAVAENQVPRKLQPKVLNYKNAWKIFNDPAGCEIKGEEIVDALKIVSDQILTGKRQGQFQEFMDKFMNSHKDDFFALLDAGMMYADLPWCGIYCDGKLKFETEDDSQKDDELKIEGQTDEEKKDNAQKDDTQKDDAQKDEEQEAGEEVNINDYKRTMSLAYFQAALQKLESGAVKISPEAASRFYLNFAGVITDGIREAYEFDRLSRKTPISFSPDIEASYREEIAVGAALGPDGQPVFYACPKSWDTAANDGERWRYLLSKAKKSDAEKKAASFLETVFGMCMLFNNSFDYRVLPDVYPGFDHAKLKDGEIIAMFAEGPQKLKLPPDYDFVSMWQRNGEWYDLGIFYQYRGLYDKAVEMYSRCLNEADAKDFQFKKYSYKSLPEDADESQKAFNSISKILGNWGAFDESDSGYELPAVQSTFKFVFRNGKNVKFTACKLDVLRIMADFQKKALFSESGFNDCDDFTQLVEDLQENGGLEKYITYRKSWNEFLTPAPNHEDEVVDVSPPLTAGGYYLLESEMEGGCKSYRVWQVADYIMVFRAADKSAWFYLSSAKTGQSVGDAKITLLTVNEVFGNTGFLKLTAATESSGECNMNVGLTAGWYWNVIAQECDQVALASGEYEHKSEWAEGGWWPIQDDDSRKTIFFATDKPAYRPGETIRVKCWAADIYSKKPVPAGTKVTVGLSSSLLSINIEGQTLTFDKDGSAECEIKIPDDAQAGEYDFRDQEWDYKLVGRVHIADLQAGPFVVSVEVPADPIKLSDTVSATIKAQTLSGQPIADAVVTYTMVLEPVEDEWYPPSKWSWLYGPSYILHCEDWGWYGDKNLWRCFDFYDFLERSEDSVVASGRVRTDKNGQVEAKWTPREFVKLLKNDVYRYGIHVNVRDRAGQTVSQTACVVASRHPFKVYEWLDKGFYNAGESAKLSLACVRADKRYVNAKGEVTLYRLPENPEYESKKTQVRKWTVDISDSGKTELLIPKLATGQYVISCNVSPDGKDNWAKCSQCFTVFDKTEVDREYSETDPPNEEDSKPSASAKFRFNTLDLVAEKSVYKPGETAIVRINTCGDDCTVVWLFVRNQVEYHLVYEHSEPIAIKITKDDIPDLIVEAITVVKGTVGYKVLRLHVPPEDDIRSLDITPDKKQYAPGDKAKIKLALRDSSGKPVSGPVTLTIYDSALDKLAAMHETRTKYDILSVFWGMLRVCDSWVQTSVNSYCREWHPQGQDCFGYRWPDDAREAERFLRYYSPEEMKICMSIPRNQLPSLYRFIPFDYEIWNCFPGTVEWRSGIATDKNGVAEIEVKLPQYSGTWTVKAWSMSPGCKVAQTQTTISTVKSSPTK